VLADLTRVSEYARLLASIGVNGVVLNNVNANSSILRPENVAGLGRIADAMRPYGIQIGISLNFASPMTYGNLTTFDPLDAGVKTFWNDITTDIYSAVPDFAGYLVKANSEGQPGKFHKKFWTICESHLRETNQIAINIGPATYNRTLAQGANLFADAIKPHGGLVIFRAFVYDYQNLNESVWTDDRALAANDYFQPLDGEFDDNVVVQIKYGPIDFQVREPASPLFGNMPHTPVMAELQISPEYASQNCHYVVRIYTIFP